MSSSFSAKAKAGSLWPSMSFFSFAPRMSFSPFSSLRPPSPSSLLLILSISSFICIALAESAPSLSPATASISTFSKSLVQTQTQVLNIPSETKVLVQSSEEEIGSPLEPSIIHLQKRQNPSTTKPKNPSATMPTPSPSPSPSQIVALADSKGDMALFGKPSVIGAYNLTSGILIYSAFLILFIGAVGSATWRRAKYRDQFRLQQQNNMESGRTGPGKGSKKDGDGELSKQASISKRALMKDMGPGGVLGANEDIQTKIAAANGAGRSFEDRDVNQSGLAVRFGESNGNNKPSAGATGRTGGMKKTNKGDPHQEGYEMNSYGQPGSASYYQDNHDTTDYSRPPLTESADAYYSSGSSHSGYLEQMEDYNSPKSKATSSPQPQYSQPIFVQRTNSSRMPKAEYHDGSHMRSNSNGNAQVSRIATQGLLDRSGSGGRSGANSPIDGGISRTGSSASSGRTRVAPSPTLMHPTPIARSNSARLPPSMRINTSQTSSNLSQQNSNYNNYS
ncbi:hypothetical protein BX616_002993 [Lobosporangium transversale]|uniref:Uncharacterized protein n=1 Tax=Lobosporangium transversale TaxID=64571 RepID=A0A1Y2GW14_9FUNG|nr:hypothetical protein BCR41DRAFT_224249 [Lobosporangium transversale]KAF9916726.1 hypothetical protein BX616_002993 [Lobosporangium transversale]ORZ26500.1 hypothetical protein BCR41DRAFT_224249 [Lobosporangium transversale]|eukprot:XP_021884265.1 hypothetical protein BCR41DRAFT_224249 [Lobosporangium transversale]